MAGIKVTRNSATTMVVALFLVTFIPAIALVVPYLCGLVPSLGWTM